MFKQSTEWRGNNGGDKAIRRRVAMVKIAMNLQASQGFEVDVG